MLAAVKRIDKSFALCIFGNMFYLIKLFIYKEFEMETQHSNEIKRVKITIALPEKDIERLTEISAKEGVSKTEALRRAIATEKYFIEQREKGHKVLIEDKNKKMRVVEWVR